MRFHRPQTLCGAAVQDFVICPDSRRPCLERVYMSRTLVIAAIAAVAMPGASAHGSGAWLDTHHTKEGKDHAGVRYISESPPHVLTMVGSDDGATWWTLKVRATPLAWSRAAACYRRKICRSSCERTHLPRARNSCV